MGRMAADRAAKPTAESVNSQVLSRTAQQGADRTSQREIWTFRDQRGHAPKIGDLADKLDNWATAIERLPDNLRTLPEQNLD